MKQRASTIKFQPGLQTIGDRSNRISLDCGIERLSTPTYLNGPSADYPRSGPCFWTLSGARADFLSSRERRAVPFASSLTRIRQGAPLTAFGNPPRGAEAPN